MHMHMPVHVPVSFASLAGLNLVFYRDRGSCKDPVSKRTGLTGLASQASHPSLAGLNLSPAERQRRGL